MEFRECAVEGMVNPSGSFWQAKRVLVLGHSGFKGSWVSLWLHQLGARVAGVSLPPPTEPSLFALAGLQTLLPTTYGDIRNLATVTEAMHAWQPEIVFHLAAQSLVRRSYRDPVETYATNVMGTVHVLEATRLVRSVRSVVVVTSDKCYENREWPWAYRETEAMGGHDPYSSSKGCAELVSSAYRRSFLATEGGRRVGVATVRAGNVIGGGDWAEDRLLPDCIRALSAKRAIEIRRPDAIRPWQHVLEPLCGYLVLAERLHAAPEAFADAWNFGPSDDGARPVAWIASQVVTHWGDGASWSNVADDGPHEMTYLKVDASRARARLGWAPRLPLQQALAWTVDWHRRLNNGESARAVTEEQLTSYCAIGCAPE